MIGADGDDLAHAAPEAPQDQAGEDDEHDAQAGDEEGDPGREELGEDAAHG